MPRCEGRASERRCAPATRPLNAGIKYHGWIAVSISGRLTGFTAKCQTCDLSRPARLLASLTTIKSDGHHSQATLHTRCCSYVTCRMAPYLPKMSYISSADILKGRFLNKRKFTWYYGKKSVGVKKRIAQGAP